MRILEHTTVITVLALLLGCGPKGEPNGEPPGGKAGLNGPTIGTWGVDQSTRDDATKPGDDFNRYANGKWMDTFQMPADLARYGTFTKLSLEAEEDIKKIVESLASAESKPGSLEQKVGDYYEAWMDTKKLDELGAKPLAPHLERIAAIADQKGLMKEFASLHNEAPFGVGIIPDPADTTRYIAFVAQSGLGMPDRDYYLKDDKRFVEYRAAYEKYVAKMLELAQVADGAAKAKRIIALEKKLAEVHWTPAESRDIKKIYNPMSLEKLAELSPQFDWKLIVDTRSLGSVKTFVVAQTTAIDKAGDILEKTPLDQWKEYLTFHFIRHHAPYLSSAFDQAHFEFYKKTLSGVSEQRARWKRGVQLVNGGLGEAVGQIYVKKHFPPAHKQQMQELVANLTAAFEERLKKNEWMDDETRKAALVKLSTFEPRIGYTEKWIDYTPLEVKAGALLENVLAVSEFDWNIQVERLGGPVDRQLWPYPPQTVNASYNPLLNQITFPAGILQPPFFDPAADPAVNYGAIGAVIGHEIGHGFDDQGRRFDEKGRIRDWWTKTADERFSKRSTKLGAQYDQYSPIEGMNVNGELTMGENIGDLGGLQMAYAAYHRYLDQCCGGKAKEIEGTTGDQRFFMGWAQVWRFKTREDELRQRLVTDPHSPPRYRVNGVVRNIDAWYEAFGVEKGDQLYLPAEERVRIW